MKKTKRGRDYFNNYKKVLLLLTGFYKAVPLSVRLRLLERHRNMNGLIGYGVRYALVRSIARGCGDNVAIAPGAYLKNPQNLILGSNISIHPMCYIECGRLDNSFIQIDDDVSIAHGATLIAESHSYESKETDIIRDMPVYTKPIHICTNVWIGAKATILYGVTVGSGCVIGAHSLVNCSTEENGIYVGAPAGKIKDRKSYREKLQ